MNYEYSKTKSGASKLLSPQRHRPRTPFRKRRELKIVATPSNGTSRSLLDLEHRKDRKELSRGSQSFLSISLILFSVRRHDPSIGSSPSLREDGGSALSMEMGEQQEGL
jgi:hypothetical protein